jgi:hypothetical protein
MPRTIGRRAVFFAVLAAIGLALVYPTPADFRAIPWVVFGLATFWAVMFAIEDLTAPTYRHDQPPRPIGDNLFAPPPRPGRAASAARREQ